MSKVMTLADKYDFSTVLDACKKYLREDAQAWTEDALPEWDDLVELSVKFNITEILEKIAESAYSPRYAREMMEVFKSRGVGNEVFMIFVNKCIERWERAIKVKKAPVSARIVLEDTDEEDV